MQTSHLTSRHTEAFPNLVMAQSTRLGGVSPAPYNSLNLGLHTADSSAHVQENRQRFFSGLGLDPNRIVGGRQIHLDRVAVVDEPGQYSGTDAFITNTKHLFLTVSVADCCPVLVFDTRTGACGAAHAGWRGTVAQIAAKMLAAMIDHYDTQPQDCLAFIGSCIGASAFEVDQDVADFFEENCKQWDPQRGKFLVDVKKANTDQLTGAGIPLSQIDISPYCTSEDNQLFFSHRKEKGLTGRGLAIIGLR
ncbi:MAG: peptidoglycan editing factor PgeF [Saprospiraceae bacterium]|jgi:polyphenol oxidase|nr:peptidoglycan editing factor PgeF [Saprospiraceae bacterium]MDP4998140.1 peptidoglycan editing factor PgeF [Saprospiraceae bacterium]